MIILSTVEFENLEKTSFLKSHGNDMGGER